MDYLFDYSFFQKLQNSLSLIADFLYKKAPFIHVNPNSYHSFWNFKKNFIQIGLKGGVDLNLGKSQIKEIAEQLLAHEIGHVIYTDNTPIQNLGRKIFTIVNILEDARIEFLMHRRNNYDFRLLHETSYKVHYIEEKAFRNPYNIGVLLRWRKWNVETQILPLDELHEEEFNEFVSDWQKAINDSLSAPSVWAVIEIAEKLYRKWEELFGKSDYANNAITGIEGKPSHFGFGNPEANSSNPITIGSGESTTTIPSRQPLNRPPDTIQPTTKHLSSKPFFHWDIKWLENAYNTIKKHITVPEVIKQKRYSFRGRRLNPIRDSQLLPPLKHYEEFIVDFPPNFKILIVIDSSGSMNFEPFYWAAHIAHVLHLILKDKLQVVTTNAGLPKPLAFSNIDQLRYFIVSKYSENFISLKRLPHRFTFTLFLTDAHVNSEDYEYLQELHKFAPVGAAYVMPKTDQEVIDAMKKVFKYNFYSTPDRVALDISLFLKRYIKTQKRR